VNAGALYFALVFGAGFVLGTVRTLWVVPRLGTRTAELMEMPIMLAVTILAARWTVLHLKVPSMRSARLEMGCITLTNIIHWIRFVFGKIPVGKIASNATAGTTTEMAGCGLAATAA